MKFLVLIGSCLQGKRRGGTPWRFEQNAFTDFGQSDKGVPLVVFEEKHRNRQNKGEKAKTHLKFLGRYPFFQKGVTKSQSERKVFGVLYLFLKKGNKDPSRRTPSRGRTVIQASVVSQ